MSGGVNWLPATDQYGRVYWYNPQTLETSWIRPGDSFRSPSLSPPTAPAASTAPLLASPDAVPYYAADGSVVYKDLSDRFSSRSESSTTLSKSSVKSLKSVLPSRSSRPLTGRGISGVTLMSTTNPSYIEEKSPSRGTYKLGQDPTVDPVKELLGLEKLPWKFENDITEVYRIQAAKADHKAIFPPAMDFAFPRYFSNMPLPDVKLVFCRVTLPKEAAVTVSYTKITISSTDTATAAIAGVLKKYAPAIPLDRCLFKVVGRAEYVYGDELCFNFEYYRYQIRHNLEIHMSLHYIPDIVEIVEKHRVSIASDLSIDPYAPEIMEGSVPSLEFEDPSERNEPWESWRCIPITRLDLPLRFQLQGIDSVDFFPRFDSGIVSVYVKFELFHGTSAIRNTQFISAKMPVSGGDPRFYQWFSLSNPSLCKIPWATRASFLVYGVTAENRDVLLGFVTLQLVDHRNHLISGQHTLRLWTVPAEKSVLDELFFICRGATRENLSSAKTPVLQVKFDEFALPVLSRPIIAVAKDAFAEKALVLDSKLREQLSTIISKDILEPLSEEEKNLLWQARKLYIDQPHILPKVLLCVDWTDPAMANSARALLSQWTAFQNPLDAIHLLDAQFADPMIRHYAVNILNQLTDFDLKEIILELVQTLKYEAQHYSVLSQFLVQRALQSPYQVGHYLFWQLKAELHNPDFCERYALILEEYLRKNRRHAKELYSQDCVVNRLLDIAEGIVRAKTIEKKDAEACKAQLRTEIAELNRSFPDRYQIPLNPRWEAKSLIVEECKYMSSKKVPLWLSFENVDEEGDKMLVIFKSGDDLRQDQLTLQLINLMDRMWLSSYLDMRMKPYTCVSTGVNKENEGVGMLEIVTKSNTISRIQIEEGGGATGALRADPLDIWIKKYNQGSAYEVAVQNFIRSCAGYCVATFVMGIGDRHNDNIMLTQGGHLFHIDFGHFLGNFKSKFGVKRERSRFVFTPEMAYVMGGLNSPTFKEFEDLCCNAFNVLRRNSTLLMALFQLMQSAGMPELTCEEDIYYLRDRLDLSKTEEEASTLFRKEMKSSHGDLYRRVDNTIHNFKHA